MDFDADPCEDFYRYTCGNWKQEHINHGWYSRFSSFETINERIAVSTMDFLKSNNSETEPLPVRQSRDLYKSCMDVGMSKLFFYIYMAMTGDQNL